MKKRAHLPRSALVVYCLTCRDFVTVWPAGHDKDAAGSYAQACFGAKRKHRRVVLHASLAMIGTPKIGRDGQWCIDPKPRRSR